MVDGGREAANMEAHYSVSCAAICILSWWILRCASCHYWHHHLVQPSPTWYPPDLPDFKLFAWLGNRMSCLQSKWGEGGGVIGWGVVGLVCVQVGAYENS